MCTIKCILNVIPLVHNKPLNTQIQFSYKLENSFEAVKKSYNCKRFIKFLPHHNPHLGHAGRFGRKRECRTRRS